MKISNKVQGIFANADVTLKCLRAPNGAAIDVSYTAEGLKWSSNHYGYIYMKNAQLVKKEEEKAITVGTVDNLVWTTDTTQDTFEYVTTTTAIDLEGEPKSHLIIEDFKPRNHYRNDGRLDYYKNRDEIGCIEKGFKLLYRMNK